MHASVRRSGATRSPSSPKHDQWMHHAAGTHHLEQHPGGAATRVGSVAVTSGDSYPYRQPASSSPQQHQRPQHAEHTPSDSIHDSPTSHSREMLLHPGAPLHQDLRASGAPPCRSWPQQARRSWRMLGSTWGPAAVRSVGTDLPLSWNAQQLQYIYSLVGQCAPPGLEGGGGIAAVRALLVLRGTAWVSLNGGVERAWLASCVTIMLMCRCRADVSPS
jgi:hypothetical protein